MHKWASNILCILLWICSGQVYSLHEIPIRNPSRFGPTVCGEMMKKYKETHLTEFPTEEGYDVDNGLNFLNFGDSCNSNAEVNFKAKLRHKYDDWLRAENDFKNAAKDDRKLEVIWGNLDEIWNKWRLNAEDGASGNRVCNPKRLLGCHQTLKKCQCLQDFSVEPVGGDPKNEDYKVIVVRPIMETLVVHDRTVNRTVCKALKGSFCDYDVPWLFFCQLECLGNEICVGQLSSTQGRKICRECTVENPEACETDESKYKILYPGKATNFRPSNWQIFLLSIFKLMGNS